MWKNKKYAHPFKSSYVAAGKDRAFQLTDGKRKITFESWQAAVKDGWENLSRPINK